MDGNVCFDKKFMFVGDFYGSRPGAGASGSCWRFAWVEKGRGFWPRPGLLFYFAMVDILKIGNRIAIAMKPTRRHMATIIKGSIILVTVLMVVLSSRA